MTKDTERAERAEAAVESVARNAWRIDRNIPVAVVVTLGCQAVALLVVAAIGLARLDFAEVQISKQDLRLEKLEASTTAAAVTQFRVEALEKTAARIESKVDQVVAATADKITR